MTANKQAKAPEKFLKVLEKAMQQHPEKLSLRQVAKRSDLSPAYLSLLLNGERNPPSNEAIARLEKVLGITDGELFKAAERPDDQALEFFRKDEAGSIMRTLAQLPTKKLPEVRQLIEQFAANQKGKSK